MGFTFCPTAVVAAPVESVWELLMEPRLYDEWWDARTERVVPEGKSRPGQVRYLKASGLGRTWDVSLRVESVNPDQYQIQLHVMLPLGMTNDVTVTCAPVDATSCLVQFGWNFTLPPGWLGWFIEKFAAKAFEADIQKTLQSLKHTAEARYHGGVVEMPSI